MKRMTVSLPDELVDRIKRAAGGERQVSAYVAAALQEYQEREKLDGILADWQAETPVPDEVRRPRRAVAQAWRSPRQARLARLLKSSDIDIAVMTVNVAGAVGLMRAAAGHDDRGRPRCRLRPTGPSRHRHQRFPRHRPHDATLPRILV